MASIRELWIPSPHNSSPRGAYLKGAYHTTEGAQKIRDLGSWFQNPSAGCSSHHGSDNYERGLFGAYVYEDRKAWTQGNGNSVCLSLEQCTPSGAASNWSRDTWLSKTILIDNAAEWMHYMAEKYKLPYKWLNNSEAQDTWSKGFCEHVNGGSSWSGHHDCGNGFPNDVVINKAKAWGSGSGSAPATGKEDDVTAAAVFDSGGSLHQACIGTNNQIYYCAPGSTTFVSVDPGSNAKNGLGIAVNPTNKKVVIIYTNPGGAVCRYEKPDGNSKFSWIDSGGNAR